MAKSTISLDAELVEEARALGLNVEAEAICEAAIREAIQAEKVAPGLDASGQSDGLWTSNE